VWEKEKGSRRKSKVKVVGERARVSGRKSKGKWEKEQG
jgi:hypothetical protein